MGRRILIIDDDDSLREVFQYTITREGYQVEGATDGAQGLKLLETWKPHLVVLDLMMPGVDGFAVLEKMRAQGMSDVPVIVISGRYTEEETESKLLSTPPVVEFMRKPVRYAELGEMIKRFLSPTA